LRAHAAAHVSEYGFPNRNPRYHGGALSIPTATDMAAFEAASGASQTSGTSSTNVQEIGVDEPDLIKTGNNRVVSVTDGVLRVQDAATGEVTGTLDLTIYDGYQSAQLLVSGDKALVILATAPAYSGSYLPYAAAALSGAAPPHATALFLTLSGTPKVTGAVRISGSYLDARMVGSSVRLVATSQPQITLRSAGTTTAQRLASNKLTIKQAPLSAWLPTFTVTDGTNSQQKSVPCTDVSHPTDYTGDSVVTVYTLDAAKPAADPLPISVAADGDTVYATATSLYVASNPNAVCCPTQAKIQSTELHRFDLTTPGKPTYLGSGKVPGAPLNQYSLSDYKGHLRVATSNGTASTMSVLDDETLKVVGQVGSIGKGEQLYAVRFAGPLAYLVTYHQTDPLAVIDLHNPAAPKVTGSLQVPGYSTYLHDAGDGRVVGVGAATASATNGFGDLQVSLFDVRNTAAPKRTGQVAVTNTLGVTQLDPHAFLYWQPTGLVAVPVQSWTGTESGKVLVVKVAGSTLTKVGEIANPKGTAHDDGLGIRRTLVVHGTLWTISGSGVRISNADTLTQQQWVAFS